MITGKQLFKKICSKPGKRLGNMENLMCTGKRSFIKHSATLKTYLNLVLVNENVQCTCNTCN